MKILFLNIYDDPADGGGAEVTLWSLIRGLQELGHECVVLSTSDGPGLTRVDRAGVVVWRAGLRNIYWPGGRHEAPAAKRMLWHALDCYNPLMQGYLREVLDHEQPDVVSSHNLPGWSSAAWGTVRSRGVPLVQVLHDQYALCPKSAMFKAGHTCTTRCASCLVYRLPHARLSNGVSAVVGVSRYVLDRHLSSGYFAKVSTREVIHNARNPTVLGIDCPQEQHQGQRIGYIGRLDVTKGIELLISEFKALGDIDAELWIAGTGKPGYEESLKEAANDGRIRFLGRVSPRDFYPKVDIVVVPSLWDEPLGMVVAEALSFGRPVVASGRGGIPEMIEHGKNGFLFEPGRPFELRGALAELCANEQLRRSMGQSARETSARFIDIGAWVRKYLDIYTSVAASNRLAQCHDKISQPSTNQSIDETHISLEETSKK